MSEKEGENQDAANGVDGIVMSLFSSRLEGSSGLCTGSVLSASFAFKLVQGEFRCFDSESESSGC